MTTAGSSVWGETDRPEILINGLSYCTVAHYVTELTGIAMSSVCV